jgi:acyl-CoA synthetase (AMP-forming)/AMP-acid ligase II
VLTLTDPIDHARRLHANRIAVIDGETRLDYAQLHDRCRRLAAALSGAGARAGDRIAVLAANGHRLLESFLAVPAHGMIVVPLNTRLAEPELKAILEDSGARILLTDRDPGSLRSSVQCVISMPGEYEELLAHAKGHVAASEDENAVAALFYTGGTTGRPKGVMLTHRNLVANAFHKALACSLTADDVFLAAPAMFHVAGIAPLVSLIWLGAKTVTIPSFDAQRCLEVIERDRATVFMPVPTMLAALVAAQNARPRDVSSLRMLGHAGSPVANAVIETAHETFPDVELAQFYGATETSSIVTCLRHEEAVIGTSVLGSCGRAVAGVAVKVVRDDGTEADRGEAGEIWIRGPNVSPGYWGNAGATAAAFAGGWYRSGDIGVLQEGDHLFVVDRLKDMIVSGAENVYSIEVEDVLQRHPVVVEAAVFGIPDPVWGEAVHAVVVIHSEEVALREELASELREHCRGAIAGYKVPKRIDIQTDPLPKSGPGKILKRVLRDPFWAGSDPSVLRDVARGLRNASPAKSGT